MPLSIKGQPHLDSRKNENELIANPDVQRNESRTLAQKCKLKNKLKNKLRNKLKSNLKNDPKSGSMTLVHLNNQKNVESR